MFSVILRSLTVAPLVTTATLGTESGRWREVLHVNKTQSMDFLSGEMKKSGCCVEVQLYLYQLAGNFWHLSRGLGFFRSEVLGLELLIMLKSLSLILKTNYHSIFLTVVPLEFLF